MSNPHLIENLTWEKANELIAAHTKEIASPDLSSNPLVSVIVHTYQHVKFIRECMDGILMQKTTFPFEIVVGDDGSTDGAYEILLEYQKQHPDKIRLFHSVPNLGRYSGSGKLNAIRSIKASRGKYTAFVEGDDYWTSPVKLQRQVDILEANPTFSGSFHDVEIIGQWGGEQIFFDYGDKTKITFKDQLHFETAMAFGSMMAITSYIQELPEWHLNFPVGDVFMMSWLTSKGPMARIPEKLGVYRRHEGGMTSNGSLAGFDANRQMLRMFRQMRKYFKEHSDNQYFDYRIRFHTRLLFKRSKMPCWSMHKLCTSLGELFSLPISHIFLTVLEQLGAPCKHQSINIRKNQE